MSNIADLSISHGNLKMGKIPSVSLPSRETCAEAPCWQKCYANKIERIRPSVANAYRGNLNSLRTDPTKYWREIEAAIMLSRFFRFHVAGDIVDEDYFSHMGDIARRQPHCQILCFTKKYNIVNSYISALGFPPSNLHIIFSAWPGFPMDNRYHLPEAHVRFRDGSTTARPDALDCPGNCSDCAITDGGCWTLKMGDQVVFDEH